jgi:hypothetical protein
VPEVTQGTITAVNVPEALAGEGSTETLADSIQVQTSDIASESGGPAIDTAGKVVGVIEGGRQTDSFAVLTPVSDLPAGAAAVPPQPVPTATTTPAATSPAAVPNGIILIVSCRLTQDGPSRRPALTPRDPEAARLRDQPPAHGTTNRLHMGRHRSQQHRCARALRVSMTCGSRLHASPPRVPWTTGPTSDAQS